MYQIVYPSDWATLPAIQYVEENNKVYEWTDGEESKSYLRYKIDVWHNRIIKQTDYINIIIV